MSEINVREEPDDDGRAELLAILREANIIKVTCEYDGEGDSGQLDELICWASDDVRTTVPTDASDGLENFFYWLLNDNYSGWEDGNGSRGGITWDVTKDKITIDHGWRVYDYEEDRTVL